MSRKSVEKIQVSLKSDKNNEYFIWRRMNICDNTSLNLPKNKTYQAQVVEKIKTQIL